MKHLMVLSSYLLASTAFALNLPLPPFKSLCISSGETGFNWKNNNWVQANFKSDQKYLVQKIELSKVSKELRLNDCFDNPELGKVTKVFDGLEGTKACYLITDFGSKPTLTDVQPCEEILMDKKDILVHCRKMSLKPDGNFIKLPWHMNISNREEKDSLVLAVGKCSKLE